MALATTRSTPLPVGDAEPPLDTTIQLVTPERIVFQYPLAGPFRRAFAFLIDLALLSALVFVAFMLAWILSLSGTVSGFGPALVIYFVLTWGYGSGCEAFFNGQTLGKRAVSIRVVTEEGIPITGAQAVLRNLVGTVDGFWAFFFMLGLTSMLLTKRFQRLGDLAAGTMVVVEKRPKRSGVVRVQERAIEALLPWLPLRIAAGPELSRALSDYVKRRGLFSPPLREEMAAPLARPLRARFGLSAEASTSSDAVLCAVYHRIFLGE